MKAEPFVVSPKTCEPALNVLGVSVTVLASNVQTQGYEITLQSGGEGVGPPPHRHDWDESFFVLRGSVEFSIDGKDRHRGTLSVIDGRLLSHNMALAGQAGGDTGRVSISWLIGTYAVITMGELMLSPMGLSLVNKLAPARMRGLLMGGWLCNRLVSYDLARGRSPYAVTGLGLAVVFA